MQTIVFLGSNKSGSSREAIIAAKEMGYFTVLLTDRKKWLKQREEFPDIHQMLLVSDLLDKELIYKEISRIKNQGKQIKAFVSFIDPLVSTAAQISQELSLAELSVDALNKMEDKTRFREILKGNPATPSFSIFPSDLNQRDLFEEHVKGLPAILKSPVSNGSKDVILVRSHEEFINTIQYFQKRFPETPILIEEFIDGPQYLIEVMVSHSTITIIAIIEQEISWKNRFIITGYQLPAQLTRQASEKLNKAIESIIKDIGLYHGTCHLEMRLVNGEWKLIEINPRISGGAINQLILEATGINLVKETLKLNLGEELNLTPSKSEKAFVQFITVNSAGRLIKVTGQNKAKTINGVKKVYVKPRKGSILTPPLSMGDRYAYVLASGENPLKVKEIAKTAAKEIKFYIEPL
jgi:biotin carboxylase